MRRAPSRASSSKLIVSSLRTASSVITLNMSRRSFLAGGGAPASFQHGQGGRYAAFSCQGLINRFRRYLHRLVVPATSQGGNPCAPDDATAPLPCVATPATPPESTRRLAPRDKKPTL